MSEKILVIGAGYAGTAAAKRLADIFYDNKKVSITLIDRNHFLTMRNQLHEVVAGRVKEKSIRVNLNQIFKGTKVKLVRDEAISVNFDEHEVVAKNGTYPYDKLIVATGSKPTYFGVPGAKEYSKPLWSYDDAVALREHIKMQFCLAKLETDSAVRKQMLTFFVVGAGLVGVELMSELAEYMPSLCDAYSIPLEDINLIECDILKHAVPDLPLKLSKTIEKRLANMGVSLLLETGVNEVGPESITIEYNERTQTIPTNTVIWAAGCEGSEFVKNNAEKCSIDGRHRIKVNQFMQAENLRDVYVGGDNAFCLLEGKQNPQIVENAEQSAEIIVHNIEVDITGKGEYKEYQPSFHGFLVSLGGRSGVAYVGKNDMRLPLPSFLAAGAKHVGNLIYLTGAAGIFRAGEYINDEFLETPDRRSFVSVRFKQPWRKK